MSSPRLKIEPIPTDVAQLQQSVDQAKEALASILMKANYVSAGNYINALSQLSDNYRTIISACTAARVAQNEAIQTVDTKQFGQMASKIDNGLKKFDFFYDTYSKLSAKVPPIPEGLDKQIPSELFKEVETFRRSVGQFKTRGDRFAKQAEEVNGVLVKLYNAQAEERNKIISERNTAKSNTNIAQVHSGPTSNSSSSQGLPSMYDAKRKASQAAASAASQQASVPITNAKAPSK